MKPLLLLSLLLIQSVKPAIPSDQKNDKKTDGEKAVQILDRITLTGHYQLIVDDPNNKFRCEMPSTSTGSDGKISAFTLVCTIPHKVPEEKK